MSSKTRPLEEQTHPKALGPTVGQPVSKIIAHSNPVVDFLLRLKQLDTYYVTPRDILCLCAIINKPGSSKQDLADAIGVPAPSNIESNVTRLIRWGYIEDRREVSRRAVPHRLHPLKEGIEFWECIKP